MKRYVKCLENIAILKFTMNDLNKANTDILKCLLIKEKLFG